MRILRAVLMRTAGLLRRRQGKDEFSVWDSSARRADFCDCTTDADRNRAGGVLDSGAPGGFGSTHGDPAYGIAACLR